MKMNNVIHGLNILSSYFDNDGHYLCAEHDIIFVNKPDKPVSKNDVAKLEALGWTGARDGTWEAYV